VARRGGHAWRHRARKHADALEAADALVVIASEHARNEKSVSEDVKHVFSNRRFKDKLVTVYDADAKESGAVPWALKKLRHVELGDAASHD
jgi:hypothetical protein